MREKCVSHNTPLADLSAFGALARTRRINFFGRVSASWDFDVLGRSAGGGGGGGGDDGGGSGGGDDGGGSGDGDACLF